MTRNPDRRSFLNCGAAAAGLIAIGRIGRGWAGSTAPIVETSAGKIRGSFDSKGFAFKGVPYGASTAGSMRFLPPAKPQPWTGVRDTIELGLRAPQLPANLVPEFGVMDRTGPTGENCLCLNVWTRGLKDGHKRPVMVWLHGGGFATGSANFTVYGDAQTGINGNQISPTGGQTLRTGLVGLIQTNSPGSGGARTITNSADAAFEKYTGIYAPNNSVSPGGCIVNDLTPVTIGNISGLDPGVITLTGPSGLSVTLGSQLGIKGAFFATLQAGSIPQSGGTFTFKGSGGADVGFFTSTITFSNPLLTWANPNVAATIDKTQGLQVTWTGGNPGTYVFITGTSTSTSLKITGGYTCLASVDAGQFTVPSYILSALPAGSGGTLLQNDVYSSLSASGIDIGLALGDISYSVASTYK